MARSLKRNLGPSVRSTFRLALTAMSFHTASAQSRRSLVPQVPKILVGHRQKFEGKWSRISGTDGQLHRNTHSAKLTASTNTSSRLSNKLYATTVLTSTASRWWLRPAHKRWHSGRCSTSLWHRDFWHAESISWPVRDRYANREGSAHRTAWNALARPSSPCETTWLGWR